MEDTMICEKCGSLEAENVEIFGSYPARLCMPCRRRIHFEMLDDGRFIEFQMCIKMLNVAANQYGVNSEEVKEYTKKYYSLQRELFSVVQKALKSDKLKVAEEKDNVIYLRKESDEKTTE